MPSFKETCDCSMYGGTVHNVKSERNWRRHLALKASDALHTGSTQNRQRSSVLEHLHTPPDLRRSPTPLLERSHTPDLQRPHSPDLQRSSPSPDLQGRSISPELQRFPSPDLQSRSVSPDAFNLYSRLPVHIPVVQRDQISDILYEDNPVQYGNEQDNQFTDDEYSVADVPPVSLIHSDTGSFSESDAGLDLDSIGLEDGILSSDSDGLSDVGQMRWVFVDVNIGSVDDPEIQLSSEDESDYDICDTLDVVFINQEQYEGFDYILPNGNHLSEKEMIAFALDDIALKHKISREASNDTRDLFSSAFADKLADYRTTRTQIENRMGKKKYRMTVALSHICRS
ncbi:hypothetical protein DFP73DRAFT_596110 [Morchella snyderi]|nr:hypothetical protein DFP73DRAFT_596110 [Morchella snyderi]